MLMRATPRIYKARFYDARDGLNWTRGPPPSATAPLVPTYSADGGLRQGHDGTAEFPVQSVKSAEGGGPVPSRSGSTQRELDIEPGGQVDA